MGSSCRSTNGLPVRPPRRPPVLCSSYSPCRRSLHLWPRPRRPFTSAHVPPRQTNKLGPIVPASLPRDMFPSPRLGPISHPSQSSCLCNCYVPIHRRGSETRRHLICHLRQRTHARAQPFDDFPITGTIPSGLPFHTYEDRQKRDCPIIYPVVDAIDSRVLRPQGAQYSQGRFLKLLS